MGETIVILVIKIVRIYYVPRKRRIRGTAQVVLRWHFATELVVRITRVEILEGVLIFMTVVRVAVPDITLKEVVPLAVRKGKIDLGNFYVS